jgi:phage-related protein (TIGR01555 family)|nr:MAG TPA: Portal [Caudoviricetes sp.]
MVKRKDNSIRADSGFKDAFIARKARNYEGLLNERKLTDQALATMYRNALVRRIVTMAADDAMKNFIEIEGDSDDCILQELETLFVQEKLTEALYWDRLFGMSCALILADDGQELSEPININRLRRINGLEVFDKRDIYPDTTSIYLDTDIRDANFGKPEFYMISPPNGNQFKVHRSRLLIFDGEMLPKIERIANNGAGLSCLDGVPSALNRVKTAMNKTIDIMDKVSTSLLKLEGLSNLLIKEDGTQAVIRRLELIDYSRRINGSVAVDKEDEYGIFNIPLTGLTDIIQEFEQALCAVTGYPFTVLFGRSPAGMNSTGKSDLQIYYDTVRRIQRRKIRPALEYLVRLIQLSKEGPTNGKELEKWSIKFKAIEPLNDLEQANVDKTQAEVRAAVVKLVFDLVDNQLLDATQARQYLKERGDIPVTESELDLDDEETEEIDTLP